MALNISLSGALNGQTAGTVQFTSDFTDSPTTPGAVNALLTDFINSVTPVGTNVFFGNQDTDPSFYTNGGTLSGFEEFTNLNSTTSVQGSGSTTGAYTVNPLAGELVVQAPGTFTLTGSANTSIAALSAESNVTYSLVDANPGVIFAAGGADSIALFTTTTNMNETVYSAGVGPSVNGTNYNDTINADGSGSLYGLAEDGSSTSYIIQDAQATITASGDATVGVHFENVQSGGSVYFINNSTAASTVFSSANAGQTAGTNVTAFGGSGGGFYIGGEKVGLQLLVGGAVGSLTVAQDSTGAVTGITQVSSNGDAGTVTLVGGGSGSILDAQGAGGNALFAGEGSETLIAASTTGANLFQLGLNYPGLGQPQSDGVVSTQGSGAQTFFLGNSAGATLYGSTASNATNTYNFVSDATAGGGVFTIENFASVGNYIFLENGTDNGPGSASITGIGAAQGVSNAALITLSDGTRITLANTAASQVHQTTLNGVTVLYT